MRNANYDVKLLQLCILTSIFSQIESISCLLYTSNIIPLAQNIYRTALPSKTATCMAVHTPLILCMWTESLFAQRVKRETNCPIVDCSDDKSLRRAIEKIKSKEIVCHTEEFFLDNMEMSVNSMVYAKSIEADVTAN